MPQEPLSFLRRSFAIVATVVTVFLAAGQVWLFYSTLHGMPWGGQVRPWHVFVPVLGWFVIDFACVTWLFFVVRRKTRFRLWMIPTFIAAAVGTIYAWSSVTGLLRVL